MTGLQLGVVIAITVLLLLVLLRAAERLGVARPNFHGDRIPAVGGVAFVLAALAAAPLAPTAAHATVFVATVYAFALLGLADDLWGTREVGGLRGHFRLLLAEKRLTTGVVKAVVGTAVAMGAAWYVSRGPVRTILGGGLIALSANSVNLMDCRPSRALKFVVLMLLVCGLAGWANPLRFPPMALLCVAVLVYAPFDFRTKVMMGDVGSNALGAAGGVWAITHLAVIPQAAVLLLLTGLLLYTERHSISELIQKHPTLSFLDRLGVPKDRGTKVRGTRKVRTRR